ncbi:MAG TPA: mechanosensitive ion channel family protein [Ramlibacter sp.]|nr:mechanosensitive ion channel family protein [Ramlibacter sp.]
MDELNRFDGLQFFGLSVTNVAIAVAVALLSYLAMSVFLRAALERLEKVAGRTTNTVDDMLVQVLRGTRHWLLGLAALLIGLGLLDLGDRWSERVGQLWFVALALQLALWLTRGVDMGMRRYEQHHGLSGTGQVSASGTLLSWFLRAVLWTVVVLAVLSNLGVNITAFVASLGIGGVAVALAVQSILGDLFASVSIAVDKPFEVGDFIGVGAVEGTVQYVGLKTTRLQSISGEQVIMSNTDLLKQVVKNYKRMEERRVVFSFGLTYDLTPEQAEQVPGIVKRLVEQDAQLRFGRAHLKNFGDSSVDYEVVYFVKESRYEVYMDAQQRLNIGLMRELKALGADFAFPTRTVIVANAPRPDGGGVMQPAPANESMVGALRGPRRASV